MRRIALVLPLAWIIVCMSASAEVFLRPPEGGFNKPLYILMAIVPGILALFTWVREDIGRIVMLATGIILVILFYSNLIDSPLYTAPLVLPPLLTGILLMFGGQKKRKGT